MNKVTVVSTGMEPQHWLPTPDKRALVRPSGLSSTAGKVAGDKPSWDACSQYAHTHGPYQWSSTRSAAQARLTAIAVEYGSPSHPLHDRSLLAAKLSNSNLKLHILNVCAHCWPAAWLVHTDHTVAYSWWCKAWTSTIFRACNPHQTFEKFISKVVRDYANFALRYGFTLSRCALPWSHNLRQSSPESKVSLFLSEPHSSVLKLPFLSFMVIHSSLLFRSPLCVFAVALANQNSDHEGCARRQSVKAQQKIISLVEEVRNRVVGWR